MTISVEKITKTTRPKKVFHVRKMTLVLIIFCRSCIKFTRQKDMKKQESPATQSEQLKKSNSTRKTSDGNFL